MAAIALSIAFCRSFIDLVLGYFRYDRPLINLPLPLAELYGSRIPMILMLRPYM